MKSPGKLLLAVSLVANLALLGIVVSQHARPLADDSGGSRGASSAPAGQSATSGAPAKPKHAPAGETAWQALVANDVPADWIANLGRAGFPDNIIHAIVSAQIRERYSAQRAVLQEKNDAAYWTRSWNHWGGGDTETRAAIRALWREEREAIKAALGDAYVESPDYQRAVRRQFGNLPPEKVRSLQSINDDYQELITEIHQSANGFMMPEDREKLAYLEKEKRADFAALLTPAELLEVEMRSSQTANSLRWQLGAFAPTEQEFRTLFSLQRDFDLAFPQQQRVGDSVLAADDPRAAAVRAFQDQIKAALGETRYVEYQRSSDHNYQQLVNITERLALPRQTAVAVYDLSKDVEKRAQQIRGDKNLKPDERNQALVTLATEAETQVVQKLGERGAEAYKENGGWWLRNIAPRPTPKPTAK